MSLVHQLKFNLNLFFQYDFPENSYVCLKNSAEVIEDANLRMQIYFTEMANQWRTECCCDLPGAVYHDGRRQTCPRWKGLHREEDKCTG